MYNTIYPGYANSYLGINNRIVKRKQEEKNSGSSENAENNYRQERRESAASYFPNGEKVAIDYTKRSIGIEQVLSDFRNTANAIGAPDEIKSEVASYLSLIESQSQKENPNPQIIQANLKNASQILDEYITDTLKKPSKVVENWVDALFLQRINYKSENTSAAQGTRPEGTVQVTPDSDTEIREEVSLSGKSEPAVQTSSTSDIYVPQDPQLRRMFIQAKKYAAIDEKERALYSFRNVMEYADEIGDTQACAMIHYEEARLYDDFNKIDDALYNYDKAARQSSDNNIKAKSHMYMGRIYDDYVILEPAVEHYCAAVSFAGEADNVKLQSKVLSDLAQIHTEKYDKQNALMFMDLSDIAVSETNDSKVKGYVASKNARNCARLGENTRALGYYGKSSKEYSDISDNENLAKNYLAAAEIMLNYGNPAKARKLLGKAFVAVQSSGDFSLKQEITDKIAML